MPAAVYLIGEGGAATAALHPLRIEILSQLSEPDSAAGLARRIGVPRQQVNYHIRQLEEQGLVRLVGERRVRNCIERLVQAVGHSYLISPAVLGQLAADPELIEDDTSPDYLVAAASRLIAEIAGLQDGSSYPDGGAPTSTLQADLHFKSREAQEAFTADLNEQVARLASKYQAKRSPKGQRFRFLAGVYPVPGTEQRGGSPHPRRQ